MKNIFKKFSGLFIILMCVVMLVACGGGTSKKLWDKYVKAVNKHDLATVGECFTETDTKDRENFVTNNADYFNNLSSIKTKSYKETINCDFSNSTNTQAYYLAEIEVVVNDSTPYSIKIYSYSNNKGLYFCSLFNFEDGFTGNEPNDYWKEKTYYHTEDFIYKNYDSGTVYIEETKNLKDAVVPAEIDGNKVTTIGEYAFYKYYKMLSFTIPTSRLRNLVIEEGIDTVGKYAFYQCNKLKSLVIPESMRYIDRMAFANCSSLERLEFQTRTKETGSIIEITSDSIGSLNGDKLVITGAHNLQVGEIIYLNAELGDNKVPRVKWSSTSGIITINESTGKVTANKNGQATITATLEENRAVSATITIKIEEIKTSDCLKMYWDAFSRCKNLKEIYIHAYNPNSIAIDSGNNWVFNSTCKIYVPKGSRDMYVSHALWKDYADQIVEMEDDDAEDTLDEVLSLLNTTLDACGDIYYAVNPNKIDHIIYAIENGGKVNLVDGYVGSKLLNNASASIISETADKGQLYNLLLALTGALSESYDDSDLEKTFEPESDDAAIIAEAMELVEDHTKKEETDITLTAVQLVENELNPNVKLYHIEYRVKQDTESTESDINVLIQGSTTTKFDKTYDGIYDLIKMVMCSASKYEK